MLQIDEQTLTLHPSERLQGTRPWEQDGLQECPPQCVGGHVRRRAQPGWRCTLCWLQESPR